MPSWAGGEENGEEAFKGRVSLHWHSCFSPTHNRYITPDLYRLHHRLLDINLISKPKTITNNIKMRTAFAVSAFVAAAFAQSVCSSPSMVDQSTKLTLVQSSVDPFPQTTYLQQTNSLGVVTGMPAVDTVIPSQPAVVTSQPAADTSVGLPASIPAIAPGSVYTIPVAAGSNTTKTYVLSANNSTTLILNAATSGSAASNSANPTGASATGSGRASGSGSQTASGTGAASTGAASTLAAGSLLGLGAFVAAFL